MTRTTNFVPRMIVALAALLLAACVVYEPVPYPAPSGFDRAWSSAVGALQDQGVTVTEQDRNTGTVRGFRGTVAVVASVRAQADGRTRVEFNATGPAGSDAGLAERISASYDRRMGR